MRRTRIVLLASTIAATLCLGTGCGSSKEPTAGPSIYTKDVPDGAARPLGKSKRTPLARLSNEGARPPGKPGRPLR